MRVVFRADASIRIGTGHVMRCLSLARELADGGAEVGFICRPHQGHMADFIRQKAGFQVLPLPEASGPAQAAEASAPHADWLGTDWRTDARQTAEALRAAWGGADWLVLDHYGLDRSWEESVRSVAGKLLLIDDLADRPHDCEALVDQNLYPGLATRYDALVPPGCARLLGPSYALLRREFVEARRVLRERDGSVRRVLIFFGGADPTDETGKALDAWRLLGRGDLRLDVVAGGANPHRTALEERCARIPGATFHFQTADMARLMADADLAVGAGGTATWERCCLSLPTLCLTIAENQRLLAGTGDSEGILRYLGHFDSVGPGDIAKALEESLRNPGMLAAMSRKAGSTVDGLGARRVAGFMLGARPEKGPAAKPRGETPSLRLRPADAGDVLTYHAWANDPSVRRNAFSTDPIPLENHEKWFAGKLADPEAGLFVLESGAGPAGQIRFDIEGGLAEIDFSVDPAFRGRGLAAELLRMGMAAFVRKAGRPLTFLGRVKRGNEASARAFVSAGFGPPEPITIGGNPCLEFRKALPAP